MRIYTDEQKNELAEVICNKCKKELKVENHILKEGCFQGEQRFGYFSNRDGQAEHFDLCERCYDEWIQSFQIPIEKEELKELL